MIRFRRKSRAMKAVWARMSPAEQAARKAKMAEARRQAKFQRGSALQICVSSPGGVPQSARAP